MKPSPFTVSVKPGPPATAVVGLRPSPLVEMVGATATMGKLTELELARPGVTTVIGATPSVATRSAGIVKVSWVALTNVVGKGVRPQFTVEPLTKRSPVTVTVGPGPPATA